MSTRCPRYEAFDASAVSYSMDTYMNAVSPATSLLCQLVLCFFTSLCSPLYLPTLPMHSLFLYHSLFLSLPPYYANAFSVSLPLYSSLYHPSIPMHSLFFVVVVVVVFVTSLCSLSTTVLCQCILCVFTSLFFFSITLLCQCSLFLYLSVCSPLYHPTMPVHSLFLCLFLCPILPTLFLYLSQFPLYHPTKPMHSLFLYLSLFLSLIHI